MATKSDVVALPGARAVARHVRIAPMKARRVVDLVRGMPAKEALVVLKFAPQAASEQVYKVLASAMANAENNERLDPDSLLVRSAFVDEGPTLKRFRPRAQGRAYRIRKRTCHITIEVESVVAAPGRRAVATRSTGNRSTAQVGRQPAPAKATTPAEPPQPAPEVKAFGVPAVQHMVFGADLIEGDVRGPEGERIMLVRPAPQSSLIEIRHHFLPEMVKSLEDY